jgi:hypothetical protein
LDTTRWGSFGGGADVVIEEDWRQRYGASLPQIRHEFTPDGVSLTRVSRRDASVRRLASISLGTLE